MCLCVLRCKKKEEENEKQSWIATLLCQIDTSMHVANANVWRTSVGVHRAEAPAESSSHFIEREMAKQRKSPEASDSCCSLNPMPSSCHFYAVISLVVAVFVFFFFAHLSFCFALFIVCCFSAAHSYVAVVSCHDSFAA